MKYEILRNQYIDYQGRKLYRIRSLIKFDYMLGGFFHSVNIGEIGGFIQSESNLPQEDKSWVSDNAKIFDNAIVSGYSRVYGNAKIYGNALVKSGFINGDCQIYENAEVIGSTVYDYACVYGNAKLSSSCFISGNCKIFGDAILSGRGVYVHDNSMIFGSSIIGNPSLNIHIYGNNIIDSKNINYSPSL
jgi:NDP-sugar pyrophosphorylase family protein